MLFETSLTATPVFGLRREMNRRVDDMLTGSAASATWAPPVDVREDAREITLAAELPGVRPDDLEVTCDNGVLSIRGQKNAERKENEGEYHLVERSYGMFTRTFRLPKGVDESRITADVEHGVLTVRVPKAALPQPKKIRIETRSANGSQQHVEGVETSKPASSTAATSGHPATADRGTATSAIA